MDQYKIIKVIGDGTFGVVSKAVNIHTGEVVAIKMMRKKFLSWEECMQLREIKSLKKLTHPNIVKLKEVIRVNDTLHMVFEFAESNLYQVMKARSDPLPENEIQSLIYQTLLGIAYTHRNGFFHRDLKPENLLINNATGLGVTNYVIKICDYGQAREIRSTPPYTEYIATRWYRAPECLLRSNVYNSPMDMFAIGCIMAELYLTRPLFPGTSENDQLFKICSVLGTPTQTTWPEGLRLGVKVGYQFPNFVATPLSSLIPNASKEAIDLMSSMLRFDPQKRITAAHALNHPYFATFPAKELMAALEKKGSKQATEFSTVFTGESSPLMRKHVMEKPKLEEAKKKEEERKAEELLNESSGSQDDPNKSLTKYSLNSSFESIASQSKGFHKTGSSGKSSRSHANLPPMQPDPDDISDLLDSNISTPFCKKVAQDVAAEKTAEETGTILDKVKDKLHIEDSKEERKALIKCRADRERKKDDDIPGILSNSPQLGGGKMSPSMWNPEHSPLDQKGTRNETLKPRKQLQPKPSLPPAPVPVPDLLSALSGESNFSYHKKHLGAAIASNTGLTGSGLRAAARDTYKKDVQLSFMDHNPAYSVAPSDSGTLIPSSRKMDDGLLHLHDPAGGEPYKQGAYGFGGTQLPQTNQAQVPAPGKFQFNFVRHKY